MLKRRARDACAGATSRPNIFSAVNNFFADSPLVNQLKGIMTRQTSSSGGEPGPPDEPSRPASRGPPSVALSHSERRLSQRSVSPAPQRQVTFLKPAADTTLDRKASIVDETSGITRTQMKGE
ncbi:hypothetical protein MSG28_005667 [Choristoneura fumiferana]|uniref:Uncharacterized protein n=1 Tax=Choristoneura fumiferana TaxID=7141 RepID=A0ACC0L0I9_CHOFU|nr:hypothetical protein MSG28_005667 [Choristoneura fumiferana]